MDAQRWHQVQSLFHAALDLPPEERTSFLEEACGGDETLYAEIASLLEADASPAPLLDGGGVLAEILGEADDAAHPSMIGPYRIVKEIGRGGMGTVYLAERDAPFRKRVALKLIKRGMDTDEIIRRFRYEREILARLEHPHVARLLDGGTAEDGRPYLVMEYVDGQPIDRYCDERKLSVEERLRLFQSVCEAVQYAHRNLVVHRDLKPSNILVDAQGSVRLLDFGIAKLLTDEPNGFTSPVTRTGVRVMTPEYAAPEQLKGEPVTTATDVYALGLLLYELLTGHRPHELQRTGLSEGESRVVFEASERPSNAVTRTVERRRSDGTSEKIGPDEISRARATSVERLQRRLRGDLDTIVLAALRPEPERRYASAEAFLEDIKRHLAGLPVAARGDSPGYRARTFIRRHRFGVSAAAAFVVLVTGFAVTTAFQQAQTTRERNIAQQERERAEETAAFLEDLLASGDPFAQERMDTLRVQDLLHRGAARVQEELEGRPLVQAQMLNVIGRVYRKLGLQDDAEPLLRKALEIRLGLFGPQHLDVAESQHELAALLYERGDYDEAERLSQAALETRRTLLGPEHTDVADAARQLAYVLNLQGRLDEAEQLHREALDVSRRVLGNEHTSVAVSLSTLASLLEDQGDYTEAESLYQESLALRLRLYGEEHPSVAVGLNNLAVLLRNQGRYEEAEPLIRRALSINRAVLGPRHPHTVDNLNILATILRGQGDYEAAEPIFREVLHLRRTLLGPHHPALSITLDSYAALLKASGKYDEAVRAQREAIAVARAAHGAEHFAVFITTSKLAGIFQARGDAVRARDLYEEALALGMRVLPDDNLHLVLTRMSLGTCLTDLGRYAEAEPLLLDSYERLREMQGPESNFTSAAQKHLAALYEAWQKPEQASGYATTPGDENAL